MYRSILVPVDGSPFAEHALPLALALARRSGAGIHLVTVSTPIAAAYLEGMYVGYPELENELNARYQAYLDRTIARLRERVDVPISGEVVSGEVAPTLCHLAGGGRYDLVVMATHGRSPLGRFWLGGIADDLMRHANVPLLLVRPEDEEANLDAEPDLSKVVLPLDGTPLAEQILEPAVALAGLMPETEIVLVRAIPREIEEEEPEEVVVRAEARHILLRVRSVEEAVRAEAEEYLARIARGLESRGLKVRTHVVVEDRPGEAILNEAEDEHAGLIALETHGRGGLSRLLHGSVADKVVRGAHVPVLVHRPVNV
jgi:nucleotide-binding universal stress UspA family protein